MKRIATLSLALFTLASSAGCLCWPGMYAPYGGGGACPGGNCYGTPGVVPGGTYPSGGYYNYGTMQSAVPYAAPTTAGVPIYSGTALAPLESLPTYY